MVKRFCSSLRFVFITLASLCCMTSSPARAVLIGGVEFPEGAVSFADAVVDYSLTAIVPSTAYQGTFNAVGTPNYAGSPTCATQVSCTFVSLGSGGSITLQFVDNRLTGSGSNALDLWVFEVGPAVEGTFVEISKDGINWTSVGQVSGATSGIDIDAFGFGVSDQFSHVRLTDNPADGGSSGGTVGADIDAVGAISTVRSTAVPLPGTLLLILTGLLPLAAMRRRA